MSASTSTASRSSATSSSSKPCCPPPPGHDEASSAARLKSLGHDLGLAACPVVAAGYADLLGL
ncbi:MAG: hypothetical protein M5U09_28070 [Gammaproteobacteria bacterium]|nr:hypothetical protein [Gammaproteobacteria bacterium]